MEGGTVVGTFGEALGNGTVLKEPGRIFQGFCLLVPWEEELGRGGSWGSWGAGELKTYFSISLLIFRPGADTTALHS